MLVDIPKDVVIEPACTVEKLGNIKLLIAMLDAIFLIKTLESGVELIVKVTVAVCKPNTGLFKSETAETTVNGDAVDKLVDAEPEIRAVIKIFVF
jgi:hypothetical protein